MIIIPNSILSTHLFSKLNITRHVFIFSKNDTFCIILVHLIGSVACTKFAELFFFFARLPVCLRDIFTEYAFLIIICYALYIFERNTKGEFFKYVKCFVLKVCYQIDEYVIHMYLQKGSFSVCTGAKERNVFLHGSSMRSCSSKWLLFQP